VHVISKGPIEHFAHDSWRMIVAVTLKRAQGVPDRVEQNVRPEKTKA
jgi:hypothetical protein